MSAVDTPPGIAFAGRASGEFGCRRRPRRLAGRVFFMVLATSGTAAVLAVRRAPAQTTELLLAVSLMCASVAAVGYAVRRARLRVDADGVRWGWDDLGFRVTRDHITAIRVYRDAVAIEQQRGSTWYVSSRDWDLFDRVPGALRRAGLPLEVHDRRAPIGARLQSYGAVLDLLLVLDALASVFALGVALGL
ncbi:MAG TPA: hypothetical protein VK698_31110 [Kofleriaceae bacterium]|nr:hypothetical protein [Kofleriaceae bacterium]